MKKLILILFLLPLSICFAVENGSESIMIESLRYEKSLVSKAIRPTSLFSLKFGRGDSEVSGDAEDEKHISYGVPFAFMPMKDGSVWLLDTVSRKLKHFGPKGEFLEAVNLENISKGDSPIRDFALAPDNGFYLYSTEDRKVFRTDHTGKILCEIEGLDDTWSLNSDRSGNVWVENPRMQSVFCFNPAGELVERYGEMDGLSNVCDADGKPFGIKGDEQNAIVYKAQTASPSSLLELASFKLENAAKAHYVSRKILGRDEKGNLYFELVACDDEGVIHQNRIYRIPETGGPVKFFEIISRPCFSPDLPRHLAVIPDGRIMGFTTGEDAYQLFTYSLPD